MQRVIHATSVLWLVLAVSACSSPQAAGKREVGTVHVDTEPRAVPGKAFVIGKNTNRPYSGKTHVEVHPSSLGSSRLVVDAFPDKE